MLGGVLITFGVIPPTIMPNPCETCTHHRNGCTVHLCAVVRTEFISRGLYHLLPTWRGQLLPEARKTPTTVYEAV